MPHTPYYNHPMVDAGLMTEEAAAEQAVSEAARQQRIVDDPTNVYGIDTSIAQNVGATSPEASATGMGFQAWMESQGLWQEYLQGEHPMAYDQWAQRPAGFSGRGLYVGDSDVEGAASTAAAATTTATTDGADVRAKMKDAFFYALRVAGMDKKLIDDLWDWVELELVNDPSFTAERALIGMYDSEAFRTRFKAIADMTDAGYGRRDMPTPGEYISFEKYVAAELSRVGVVETDFDGLITKLYMAGVGDTEVTERLNKAQKVMWEMPPEVRDKLTDWFGGIYGTSITMKTFLDNTGDWSKIQDDISTARTGGWGQMVAGLNAGWDEGLAKKVSDLGLSQAEQWSRFAELKEKEMLFAENIDEAVDLDYAKHGVAAEFDLDIDLAETIERRATGRSARFSGGGGALLSGTTTGFGAANA